ncbi:uncharacterized protein VICG_00995 [Vittaforma corneae ATCC 50505]|uniref:Uncharacterized protein n=1 Tax=Vittaforma corneae (strain ATCC 50505) TaxID=993615 RepID=L2GM59_VITCO|nr:uncharacterized protein VICG_00995 [Vittaforma corneae ATCC 50505]ELA41978.1 hypothetical protein VICG_00995 [Vittaforma corneae ATCC 50505]
MDYFGAERPKQTSKSTCKSAFISKRRVSMLLVIVLHIVKNKNSYEFIKNIQKFPMQAENKTRKLTSKTVIKKDLQARSNEEIKKSTIAAGDGYTGSSSSRKDSAKIQKTFSHQENLKSNESKKKEYQNPGLESSNEEGETSLQSSIQSLRISANPEEVISKELLKYKNVKWSDLNLSVKSIKVLTSLGYNFPSPVQYQSIPNILAGNDVLVRAKNGSGKSLSFLIPIIEKINIESNNLQAIIVAPTRELALQIARFARSLCKDLNIKSAPLIGGSNIKDDIIRVSSGVQLLIGSPGRLYSILSKKLCQIDNNLLVVFDEADKLLDSLFFEDIYSLLQLLPKKKQMCLFSATFPQSAKSFINVNLSNPKLIKVNNEYALFNIAQFYCVVDTETKLPCLKSLLACLDIDQCIIYVNSINHCQILAKKITEMGVSCYFIHSNLSQDERNQIFHNFSKNKTKILVSSDITTRGTDVQGVNVVINFELPMSSESYLHRIGRAGRFGKKGCCISIIHKSQLQLIHSYAQFVGTPVAPCTGNELKKFCRN